MDKKQYYEAKTQLVASMQQGHSWQEAAVRAGMHVSQSTAYRLLQAVQKQGEAALQDRRHGHSSKLRGEARTFLETSCREVPSTRSSSIQAALQEHFDLRVSISQINRVRAVLGVSNHSKSREQGKKRE